MQISPIKNPNFEKPSRNLSNRTKVKILKKGGAGEVGGQGPSAHGRGGLPGSGGQHAQACGEQEDPVCGRKEREDRECGRGGGGDRWLGEEAPRVAVRDRVGSRGLEAWEGHEEGQEQEQVLQGQHWVLEQDLLLQIKHW